MFLDDALIWQSLITLDLVDNMVCTEEEIVLSSIYPPEKIYTCLQALVMVLWTNLPSVYTKTLLEHYSNLLKCTYPFVCTTTKGKLYY